jgi:hypothetical protein
MPKYEDIVIHFDDLNNEPTGGLKGVSKASGFIQRAMAEMKNKSGYKKGATDLSALKLKDDAKFNPRKVSRQSEFINSHLIHGVPWQQRRAVPILSTGQTARVREVDGKKINFNRTDPEYNRATLRLYPLPRADARPLTEGEKKALEKYRKAYTEALKEAVPSVFVENPNQPPKEVPNVIKRKPGRPPKVSSEMIGKKRKSAPIKIERNPTDIFGLPRRLGSLLTEQEGFSPMKGEIAERKYSLLSPAERELSEDDRAKIAKEKYIAWRKANNNRTY